jgi:hypothetical protein
MLLHVLHEFGAQRSLVFCPTVTEERVIIDNRSPTELWGLIKNLEGSLLVLPVFPFPVEKHSPVTEIEAE